MSEGTQGFDSTSSADVQAAHPAAGDVVFGYANGAYAWSTEDWAKFPEQRHAVIVEYVPGESIVGVDGDILDVEASYLAAGSPNRPDALSQASQWSQRQRAAGRIPGGYTSLTAQPDLAAVMGSPTAWFVADWTGAEHQDEVPNAEVIATQYASPSKPAPGEGHWDLSEIDNAAFDAWWEHNHPGQPLEEEQPPPPAPANPPPPPPPSPEGEVTVQVPELAEGAEGASVEAAQRLLTGINPDGIFGPVTKARVENYQRAHNLDPDGIIGPHSWGSLLGVPQ
jgi:peptidoglycan hydrolase-like protein with peptidoglycan-binding domain